jgi:hypothetical protein
MSLPCGPTGPFFILDRHVRNEITAHRAKVFAALSRHSDPAMREIGRLLAHGTATSRQLLEDPRYADRLQRAEHKLTEMDPAAFQEPARMPNGRAGTGRSNEAGPASRPDDTDPDNGAGGVPAIRR